jgi:N12 class adenine-specific DNA methylase
MTMAAAIMEQRRLGLIAKAMLVVPGHCLAQAAREFLGLYPSARILVADETNFTKDKRHRFLSRAATATWDAIIITHSAFRFIGVPSAFEQRMIQDELELYEQLLTKVESDDRVSRKRLERLKEGLKERLEALATRKDDLLTISEIGVDQISVDEAQEFRKLSFATNMSTLKGVDPNGSQRAWDLYVKSRFIETKNPGRALVLASGTPIGLPEDLQQYVKVPAISTGKRQILTAKPTPAFKRYQALLDARIKAIETRDQPPEPGDDILLSVITDGRHAAIDLRLVDPDCDNEPNNKLNLLVGNAFRIWKETSDNSYVRADGKPYELSGAAQMIFSDLATISVEKTRGFSAYRWIRDELVRMGPPPSEIAFMQDFKKSEAKQRLFGEYAPARSSS